MIPGRNKMPTTVFTRIKFLLMANSIKGSDPGKKNNKILGHIRENHALFANLWEMSLLLAIAFRRINS